MFWKKCPAFVVLVIYFSYLASSQDVLDLQPNLEDDQESTTSAINLQPNFGNDNQNGTKTSPDGCECIPFYQCRNGTVNTDGAGLFTIR